MKTEKKSHFSKNRYYSIEHKGVIHYMIYLFFFIPSIIFMPLSCNSHKNNEKIVELNENDLVSKRTLHGDTINVSGLCGSIKQWDVSDNKILLVDIKTEKLIHIYSFPSFSFIGDYVDRGKGPGEVLNVWDLQVSNDGFWVFDGNLKKMIYNRFEEIINNSNATAPKEVKIEHQGIITQLYWLNDTMLLANMIWGYPEVFNIINLNNKDYSKPIGLYPELESPNIPLLAKSNAFYGHVAINKTKDKIFDFCKYADCIIEMKKDGSECKYIFGNDNYLPRFAIASSGGGIFMPSDETIMGYYSVTSTNNYIYTVYSGKPFKSAGGGRELRIFDWNGKLKGVFRFDRIIEYVMPDEKEGMIYAYSELLEHNFIKFKFNFTDL